MVTDRHVMSAPDNGSIHEWITHLFKIIDSKSAPDFAEYFRNDGRFVYGSNAPIYGKQAICDYVDGFFGTLESIQHTVFDACMISNKVFGELEVTYVLKDGRHFTFPAFDLIKMDGELIQDFLIYVDPSPMFSDA